MALEARGSLELHVDFFDVDVNGAATRAGGTIDHRVEAGDRNALLVELDTQAQGLVVLADAEQRGIARFRPA